MDRKMYGRIINETKRFIYAQYPAAEAFEGRDKLKFRVDGKPVFTIYMKEGNLNFLLALDREKKKRFEKLKDSFPESIVEIYYNADEYADVKWVMVPVSDMEILQAVKKLITK